MARKRTNVRRVLSVCEGCDKLRSSAAPFFAAPFDSQSWFGCNRAGRARKHIFNNRSTSPKVGFEFRRVPLSCPRIDEHATLRALRGL